MIVYFDKIYLNFTPIINISDSSDFFDGLVHNRWEKIVAIILSGLGSYLAIGLISFSIWYDRYSYDVKRTLLNYLARSAWMCSIIWSVFVQQLEIVRYVFGPLPFWTCQIVEFSKRAITMQGIMLLNFLAVTRYIFIFILKNPAGFNDDIWGRFIDIWIFLFVMISQFVVAFLPGKQFPDVLICTGMNPDFDTQSTNKPLLFNNLIKAASFLLNVFIAVKIHIYKWNLNKENSCIFDPRSKLFWIFSLEVNRVVDIKEALLPVIFVAIPLLLSSTRASIDLLELNNYPHYYREYFYSLIRPVLTILLMISIKYLRDGFLRETMQKECSDLIQRLYT